MINHKINNTLTVIVSYIAVAYQHEFIRVKHIITLLNLNLEVILHASCIAIKLCQGQWCPCHVQSSIKTFPYQLWMRYHMGFFCI